MSAPPPLPPPAPRDPDTVMTDAVPTPPRSTRAPEVSVLPAKRPPPDNAPDRAPEPATKKNRSSPSPTIAPKNPPAAAAPPILPPPPPLSDGDLLSGTREFDIKKSLLADPIDKPAAAGLAATCAGSIGCLIFYCYDVAPSADESTVLLFGRVLTEGLRTTASCCVRLQHTTRVMYALPRNPDVDIIVTDDEAKLSDALRAELLKAATTARLESVMLKPKRRNNTFDTSLVPRGSQWFVKIKTNSWNATFPRGCFGTTFSKIYNCGQTLTERVILKLRMQGPEWFAIPNGYWDAPSANHNAWVAAEFAVIDEASVWKLDEWCDSEECLRLQTQDSVPPPKSDQLGMPHLSSLTMDVIWTSGGASATGLAMATFLTDDGGRFAVVNVGESNANPRGKYATAAPPGRDARYAILCKGESASLSKISEIINRLDPDVLVGHKLLAQTLPTLFSRYAQLRNQTWTKIGRIKKGGWIQRTEERKVTAFMRGRIACDTYSGLKEHARCVSYELPDVAVALFGKTLIDYTRSEVDAALNGCVETGIDALVDSTAAGAKIVADIARRYDLLPLATKLARLCGYTINGCLNDGRAKRTEYALAHAFHDLNFILPEIPDRASPRDDGGMQTYSGGLVLPSQIGVHNTDPTLNIDFKSMYPSLIIANNICFATAEYELVAPTAAAQEEDEENDEDDDEEGVTAAVRIVAHPPRTKPLGVLPTVIKKLVDARRAVKDALKKEKDPARILDLTVEQQALKILANAMYGCLGFSNARFASRPLAALITSLGRQKLEETAAMIKDAFGLVPRAGDTDSLMLNSEVSTVVEAQELGRQVAEFINEQQTSSAMEVELADVFERVAFFTKKHYAALSTMTRERYIIRGLDMIRRDWCGLAKKISNTIVSDILAWNPGDVSENAPPHPVDGACDLLADAAADMDEATIPVSQYTITKMLSKPIESYGPAKGLLHIEAARALLATGVRTNPGETISYIICYGGVAVPARIVIRDPSRYSIDGDYYKFKQLLPTAMHLLKIIDPSCEARLSESMGRVVEAHPASSSTVGRSSILRSGGRKIVKNVLPLVRCADPACPSQETTNGVRCGTRCNGTSDALWLGGRGLCCGKCGKAFTVEAMIEAVSEVIKLCTESVDASLLRCPNAACPKQYKREAAPAKCPTVGCGCELELVYGRRDLARQVLALCDLFDVSLLDAPPLGCAYFTYEELELLDSGMAIANDAAERIPECKIELDFLENT